MAKGAIPARRECAFGNHYGRTYMDNNQQPANNDQDPLDRFMQWFFDSRNHIRVAGKLV
jgi:hypothetical protein